MRRSPAMPWVLSLLDDGLRLYRRNLAGFLKIGSVVLVPLAVFGLLLTTLVRTQLGEAWALAGGVLVSLLQYPALIYAYVGLSRAAVMALDGEKIRVAPALRMNPLRAAGTGCYSLLFTAIVGTVASIVVLSVACPVLYMTTIGATVIGTVGGGSGTLGAGAAVLVVLFVLLLLLLLLTFGAVFASQIYAVQAFALERQPFSSALGRSVDLLTYRFGRNMLMFMCAGAISGTLSLSYLGTLIGLITWVSLDQSPALRDAATSTVTTLSQVVLLPPLPIWMALLHGRLAQERDAPDLRAAIQQWHATPDGEALIS